jgi:Fur family peroxide stress response transcriptional regulator
MKKKDECISDAELDERTRWLEGRCREIGLKVTPQRVTVYRELLKTNEHPSAEMLYRKVKRLLPSISLDTVSRTLLTLAEIGTVFVVEGSGDPKRFDGGLQSHQHFRCVKCRRIIDFHHRPFDNVRLPPKISKKFTVTRKTVYLEGLCNLCR